MSREPEVTVVELVRRIEAGRADFDALLATNPPPTAHGWTSKDHIAHVACWEHSALNLLNGEPRFAHLGLTVEQSGAMGHDAINDLVYAAHRDDLLEDITAYYDAVHRDLLRRLESMTDEDLLRSYSHYQPNDPPHNENPVWPWIVGNTFGHYEEHAAILRAS